MTDLPKRKPGDIFRDLLNFIEESNTALDSGKDVSLEGMEKRVAAFCMEVQRLTPTEAQTHKPRLELLFKELSTLEARLRASYDELKGQIENLGVRQKAAVAYQTVNILSKKDDKA